jgi:hypothetical protein
VIDLGGKGSFLRFWLPLILLAALIALIFPPFHPKPGAAPRETWDGLVILVTVEPPPAVPIRLLVALPLAPPTAGAAAGAEAELLVVGEASIAPGAEAQPVLLVTPQGADGLHLARRVAIETSSIHRTRARLVLHRAADLAGASASLVGAVLREGALHDGGAVRALPPPLGERAIGIDFDPVRHRRWPGVPETFREDWERFRIADPGGMTSFIHGRVVVRAVPTPRQESPAPPPR